MKESQAVEGGKVERLLLKKIEIGVSKRMPGVYFQDVEWETHIDHAANDVVFQLRAFLYGRESVVESDEIDHLSFPATWFEQFKGQYFPRWLLKRWPVVQKKYSYHRKVITQVTKVCPHLNVKSQYDHLEFFLRDDPFKRPL